MTHEHDDGRARYCGLPVRAEASDRGWPAAKWRDGLAWKITGDLPGVVRAAFRSAAAVAFKAWSDVSGLPAFREAVAGERAHIVITTGRIDGRGGTLGWSTLPPGDPVEQRYDVAEPWDAGVDLISVLIHEGGHALGLQHDAEDADAIMAPFYNPRVLRPTRRDAARMQALYGEPAPTKPTPGEADLELKLWGAESVRLVPSAGGLLVLQMQGVDRAEMVGYRMERL